MYTFYTNHLYMRILYKTPIINVIIAEPPWVGGGGPLDVLDAPVLVDGALVSPGDDLGPVTHLLSGYVQALPGEHPIDDPVALDEPLLAGVAAERLKVGLITLGSALYRVLVKHGS